MISELCFTGRQLLVSVPEGKKWSEIRWISRSDALPAYPLFSNQLPVVLGHLRPTWLPKKDRVFYVSAPCCIATGWYKLTGHGDMVESQGKPAPGLAAGR